ncbi:MAG: sigma-70 family RNA polymerase sigma factor [Eubacteriaceae bacterium]|nr:sigma-70 family RNA polymerase sigma factor [Eubacteriaceae bacterium]
MLKTFKTQDGIKTTIEITREGKVTYAVGKKKTTFDIKNCEAITYEFSNSDEKAVITEDMLSGTENIEAWLWLVISEGENRLEENNTQTETRRHYSYSDQNDKFDTLISEYDVLDNLLDAFEKETVREAIRSLEPQQQELIQDIYYRGLSMADVARRDGVNKSSITKRMDRILKRLKENFKNF